MRREDVWRSLKRLLALAFDDPWTIRLEQAQYAEEERPLIIVEPIGDMARTGVQPTVPGAQHVVAQTFVATAYPAVLDDPREAREQADAVLDLFMRLVTVGWVQDDVAIGGPLRLPIWDYAGVPVTGVARGNSSPLAEWDQIAWVETWSGTTIPDPQDDRRYTIPYSLRLSWEVASRYEPAPVAAGFGGAFVADPPVFPHPEITPSPGLPGPVVPVIQGPAGPPGPIGVPGPAGGAMVSGWWNYHTATTAPPSPGQIRTAPAVVSVGGAITIFLSRTDRDGLYWLEDAMVPGDEIRLRGTAGAVQHIVVQSFAVSGDGPGDYATIVGILVSKTDEIAKNADVEGTVIREPLMGPEGPMGPAGPPGPAGRWVQVTQAEYDALSPPDPTVLYVIIG